MEGYTALSVDADAPTRMIRQVVRDIVLSRLKGC
jgi:hypothetical protein